MIMIYGGGSMENWKHLFKPWIMDRGYEYYMDDTVLDIEYSDGIYTTCVIGV